MTSHNKPRVLVFIDWFLPGDRAGGPVRSCANLIDHLGDEFDFSVVTRDTDYMELQPYKTVRSDAWNTLPDGKRVYYISPAALNRETISRLLREEKYDTIYVNGIWSQPFTAWPLQEAKALGLKRIVAVRGMLAPAAMAIKATKKKVFLVYAQLRGIFSGVTFHATTEQEANETKAVFGKNSRVKIAGNLPRIAPAEITPRSRKPGALRIVSVARVAPEKNTLYAIEALTKVTAQVTADFYGTVYSEAYLAQCMAAAKSLPANVTASFHEATDSSSIISLLSTFDLLFLPTRGENFGHVILEAMQAGTPVLISDKTPWRNLAQQKAGWDLPLDDPQAFATKIDEVEAMPGDVYREWSEGALKLAAAYTENRALKEANAALFRS